MNAHGVIPQSLPLDRLCRDKKQRKQKRVESKSKQASEYILEYIYIYMVATLHCLSHSFPFWFEVYIIYYILYGYLIKSFTTLVVFMHTQIVIMVTIISDTLISTI